MYFKGYLKYLYIYSQLTVSHDLNFICYKIYIFCKLILNDYVCILIHKKYTVLIQRRTTQKVKQ